MPFSQFAIAALVRGFCQDDIKMTAGQLLKKMEDAVSPLLPLDPGLVKNILSDVLVDIKYHFFAKQAQQQPTRDQFRVVQVVYPRIDGNGPEESEQPAYGDPALAVVEPPEGMDMYALAQLVLWVYGQQVHLIFFTEAAAHPVKDPGIESEMHRAQVADPYFFG